MKNILKVISTMTALAILLSVLTVFAHAETTAYTVPEGKTEVQNYDFSNKNYTSITIPASVTKIGIGIFRNFPNLKTITVDANNPVYYSENNCIIEKATGTLVAGCAASVIPSTVTGIGDYAFYYCPNLINIDIPSSVKFIGKKAFSNCPKLEAMHLPDSVRYIDDQVFNECTSLKEITLSKSLTYLPVGMCYKCSSLEKLVIPNSVTSVEGNIIQGCSLSKGIYIPKSVVNVASTAFNNHRYTPFYYEGTFNEWKKIETYLDYLFTSYIQERLVCNYPYEKKLVYVDDNVSLNIKVVNGEGVIETVGYAIGDVEIPSEVEGYPITKIEIAAFAAKPSLTSITFPDSITQLGNRCFYNSDALTKVVFPKGITEIPPGFMLACDSISEIEIPDSVKTIGNSAFSGCKSLESITVPEGVTHIDNAAFKNCTELEEVILPDSVTTFGTSVFDSTPNLKSITLPKATDIISGYMFNLSGLERITIPNGVRTISYYAFSGTNIKEVIIPGSVTNIGEGAFGGCTSLERVVVEEGAQNIYKNVFSRCPALKSVTLPSTLTKVDLPIFSGSSLLTDICYTNTDKQPVRINYSSEVTERFETVLSTYSFNANGGSSVAPISGTTGVQSAPYCEKEGYVLAGWALSPEDNAPVVKFPFYSNKDVTLYAKWIAREDCIIMKIDQKEASLYGKTVTNDVAPIIENNRTMLPVRFVAESLGATVEWVNEARYIRITGRDGNIIDMRVDETGTFANGCFHELDVAPFVRNNRTYTPVRFVAESLGTTVLWNQQTKEVILIE